MIYDKPILAWHFTYGMNLRDGQDLIEGKTYHVDPPIYMCMHGLHASKNLIDACKYSPADSVTLSRVELSGDIIVDLDKCVATDRKVIIIYKDISKEILEFIHYVENFKIIDGGLKYYTFNIPEAYDAYKVLDQIAHYNHFEDKDIKHICNTFEKMVTAKTE